MATTTTKSLYTLRTGHRDFLAAYLDQYREAYKKKTSPKVVMSATEELIGHFKMQDVQAKIKRAVRNYFYERVDRYHGKSSVKIAHKKIRPIDIWAKDHHDMLQPLIDAAEAASETKPVGVRSSVVAREWRRANTPVRKRYIQIAGQRNTKPATAEDQALNADRFLEGFIAGVTETASRLYGVDMVIITARRLAVKEGEPPNLEFSAFETEPKKNSQGFLGSRTQRFVWKVGDYFAWHKEKVRGNIPDKISFHASGEPLLTAIGDKLSQKDMKETMKQFFQAHVCIASQGKSNRPPHTAMQENPTMFCDPIYFPNGFKWKAPTNLSLAQGQKLLAHIYQLQEAWIARGCTGTPPFRYKMFNAPGKGPAPSLYDPEWMLAYASGEMSQSAQGLNGNDSEDDPIADPTPSNSPPPPTDSGTSSDEEEPDEEESDEEESDVTAKRPKTRSLRVVSDSDSSSDSDDEDHTPSPLNRRQPSAPGPAHTSATPSTPSKGTNLASLLRAIKRPPSLSLQERTSRLRKLHDNPLYQDLVSWYSDQEETLPPREPTLKWATWEATSLPYDLHHAQDPLVQLVTQLLSWQSSISSGIDTALVEEILLTSGLVLRDVKIVIETEPDAFPEPLKHLESSQFDHQVQDGVLDLLNELASSLKLLSSNSSSIAPHPSTGKGTGRKGNKKKAVSEVVDLVTPSLASPSNGR